MKVTVCQLDSRPSAIEPMLEALGRHVRETGTDFLLLPEMGLGEWLAADPVPDEARWRAAVAEHDRRIDGLKRLGVRAAVGTRPVVRAQGSRRNEAFVWTAEAGAEGVRDKYYLPDEELYWENTWYDRGEKRFDLARALGMRVGILICTEMWFLEWSRHYARSRADLLCIPRVTPHYSNDLWLAGGRTAAYCSGAYCLSSNLWTPPGDKADCGGGGWIVDPDGNVLATTSDEAPFATVEIDLAKAAKAKSTYPRYVME